MVERSATGHDARRHERKVSRRAILRAGLIAGTGFGSAMLFGSQTRANSLPPPNGEVLLKVSGRIENTSDGEHAYFDRAMLESIGLWNVNTSTPWSNAPNRFEGVLARDLLRAVGAKGDRVTAKALNDYVIDIPIADFLKYPVILAIKKDDNYLKIRDKGPIQIVYPRDSYAELNSPRYSQKWVWHLSELIVK
ncbi:MAG: molybdopterin-dependent oxidoreductase [Rhodospirillaceae bacterium]|nr:molybdopterin-dependent oxidoreductase [Rhodospirillaceae bacterium]